jgi:hypothetical protein
VGCREVFLRRKVSVVLWLFLFKGGEFLEVFCGAVLVSRVFWEVLDRTVLTGLPNRSDRFPLPVERLSPTEAV